MITPDGARHEFGSARVTRTVGEAATFVALDNDGHHFGPLFTDPSLANTAGSPQI